MRRTRATSGSSGVADDSEAQATVRILISAIANLVAIVTGALLAYSFVVYPRLLEWLSRRKRAEVSDPERAGDQPEQGVSVVLVVRNEANNLPGRVENLREQRHGGELQVVIVVDQSSDATGDVARALAETLPGVETHALPEGVTGKAAGINLGVSRCHWPVVVFCDARQRFRAGAVDRLVRAFEDAEVGAVTGIVRPVGAKDLVNSYRRYDDRLRQLEAEVDSAVQCAGAIYAVRKNLFVPLPPGLILDDMWVPQWVVLQGRRVAVAPEAIADDPLRPTFREELRRKARTLGGNFQLARDLPQMLSPRCNPRAWWMVWSHKYLRLLVPVFSAACIVAALVSPSPWMRAWGALLAAGLVAGALTTYAWQRTAIDSLRLPLRLAGSMFLAHASIVAGAVRFVAGGESKLWQR